MSLPFDKGSLYSRFWRFQIIAGGWLPALSLILSAVTVWLIRHRAA